MLPRHAFAAILIATIAPAVVAADPPRQATEIDLRTAEGVEKVKGQWRYGDVKLVEVPGKNPDGSANTTYNIEPKAFGAEFDDSAWPVVDPTTLGKPRGTGQVCFGWYRIQVTLPPEAEGKKVSFSTIVDDYGEIWVDGKLPRAVGQNGGSVVAGFNAVNRVELADPAPGKTYQIAIFGINGPISAAPGNWLFLRQAVLELAPR